MKQTPTDFEKNIGTSISLADLPTTPRIPITQPVSRTKTLLHTLNRYQGVLIGSMLFLAALTLNLYRLGNPDIWFDEAFSIELSRQPLPVLWHIIFNSEPSMELYYLFLHFWLQLTSALGFAPIEFVVRLPSAIFAAGSTVALFAFGRRFLGVWVGTIGASLYLLNDLQLVYAQQTRSYSLQLLLLCLSWYTLFAALTSETHQKRWWLGYTVMVTLAFYAHLFSAFILIAQFVTVIGLALVPNPWRGQIRKQLYAFGVSLLASGILSIPLFLVSRQGSKTGWLPIPHLRDVHILFLTFSANHKNYLLLTLALCGLGMLTALLVHLAPHSPLKKILTTHATGKEGDMLRQRLAMIFALLCWLVLPIIFSYIISQGPTRLFSSRYLVTIVPSLCLLIGLGIVSLRWRIVKGVLAVAIILLAASYTPQYYASAQSEVWSPATSWLAQKYQLGDGMVCYTNWQGCQMTVEYYLSRYQSPATFDANSPGAYSWSIYGYNPTTAAGAEAAVDPTALAAYGSQHPRLFFIVARLSDDTQVAEAHNAEKWLDSHYHFIGEVVTPTVTIRLYATGAATQV